MAHHTNKRRNLASSDPNPKTSMDPTHKKHPYTTTTTSSTTKPHPTHPDPTTASSTIHTIANHFSRLYTNHKVLASLKPSNPPSKPMTLSATIEDTSTTTFKKSNHQRRPAIEKDKKWSKKSLEGHDIKIAFERGKTDEVKKLWKKDSKKKESHEGHDMEIAFERGKTDEVKKLGTKDSKKKESHEGYDVKRSFVSLSRSQDFELKESHSLSLAMGGGGRRRSFCNSQTELTDFLACNGVKIVSVDMPPFMQVHAVNCARKTCDSLEKFAAKTLAFTLKKEFDGVYGPAWHCVVGTSFGSFVTHSVGGFLYFSMDHKLYILLFKTTVQKAD